ncbi:Nramp family divalent metal transporter [Piscinibacter terrae]|uniref:Divalent metal cation transporter n=1 Tax=Piscinibacter terrae TaxID=2496871 RepID=A0A3N7HJD1_9BURK|nr:Nramp family divalent metal transporter [Albitalea terrae]RQP22167.1 divalent metal cation transporter [Albitalea terrae]
MLFFRHAQRLASRLGPGLITGAADDDPSGLATYSQAGAQFGAGMLWTLAFTTPLMIGIQMVSARIGWLTGQGLAANICKVMPRWMAFALVSLLVFANTLNIAADVAAMGEALQLVAGGPEHGHALLFGVLCAVLPVWLSYEAMVRVLKYLTLALLAYVAVVFMLHVDWERVLMKTLVPSLSTGSAYWTMIVGVLGTTISPYLFFWQAAQEAEQRQRIDEPSLGLAQHRHFVLEHLYRIKLDTVIGMGFSNLIAFCVMLATAITLNQHGITDIQTTRQAAEALRPIAGEHAFVLFALGIIGTGMLAVPVLAGSAAYAVADVFHWRSGLDHTLSEAKGFYAVVLLATMGGTLIDFSALDPIKALVWSAVVNGVVAVPIMAVMMWLGTRRDVLGEFTLTMRHRVLGWIATAVMAAAVVGMFWTW